MEIWKRAFPLTLRMNPQKRSIFFEKKFCQVKIGALGGGFYKLVHAPKDGVQSMECDTLVLSIGCGLLIV